MITYRHFRNSDPPGLCAVWRSQPALHGRCQPLTPLLFEPLVLAKPYFDARGLIVAVEHDKIVGFAHAGFGAAEDRSQICRDMGVVCTVLALPHPQHDEICTALLARAEDYLREAGAKVMYGGQIDPLNPYYRGMYGGSELPGVLKSDEPLHQLFVRSGYREIDRVAVLERDLAGFRAPVDRKLMQVRRQYNVEATFDPPAANWWEACAFGHSDRTRFVLRSIREGSTAATVTFWDMEPLAASWGSHAVGLLDLETQAPLRRQGLATQLLGEALRQLHAHGIARCQVQCMAGNAAALALYAKLGFQPIDEGIVLRKEPG